MSKPLSSSPMVRSILRRCGPEDGEIPNWMPRLFYPPPFDGELTSKSYNEARRMEPLRFLPEFLIAPEVADISHLTLLPPIFHFGWRPDFQKMLAFAESRTLTVVLPQMDDRERHTNNTQAAWDPEATFITFRLVVQNLMDELKRKGIVGKWSGRVEARRSLREDDGNNLLIAVLTNYDLRREESDLPSVQELSRLGRVLQDRLGAVDASPKWYVDETRYDWHSPELNHVITMPGLARWRVEYDGYGQTVAEEYYGFEYD